MEDENDYYEFNSFDMALRPTCYSLALFEQYEPISANDDSYDGIEYPEYENLYTLPC